MSREVISVAFLKESFHYQKCLISLKTIMKFWYSEFVKILRIFELWKITKSSKNGKSENLKVLNNKFWNFENSRKYLNLRILTIWKFEKHQISENSEKSENSKFL